MKLDIALFGGDGIGDHRVPGTLTDSLDQMTIVVGEEIGHEIAFHPVDLSLDGRCRNVAPAAFRDHFRELVDTVQDCDGRFMKMPTTTATTAQVANVLASHDDINLPTDWSKEQVEAYIAMQQQSPNAILRGGLDLSTMERPVYGYQPELAFAPKRIAPLEVMTVENDGMFEQHEGSFRRGVSEAALQNFVMDVMDRGRSEGKGVLFVGKHTISKLDEVALKAFLAAKQSGEFKDVPLDVAIFDSFLPRIMADMHAGKIVACLPDQAGMLQGIASISGKPLFPGSDLSLPERRTLRVAKGSGYGEQLFRAGDLVAETHTLPERDIRMTALLAVQRAEKMGTRPILVLSSDGSSPADQELQRIVYEAIGNQFDVMSLSDMYAHLAQNPADADMRIFITANNVGDYLSDITPVPHYGQMGVTKALGAGENLNLAFNDAGEITVIGTDPSTGTAADLIRNDNLHLMLPAGILLSLATLLAQDPRLPQEFRHAGLRVRQSVIDTLIQHRNANKHESFTSDVIAHFVS